VASRDPQGVLHYSLDSIENNMGPQRR